MPLYAYRCPACGARCEQLRPASRRDEPVHCEACGHGELRRDMESYACAVQGATPRGAGAPSGCGGGGGFT